MKVKIDPTKNFDGEVFGSEDLLHNFPELETVGIEVRLIDDLYYIIKNGKIAGDCCFFSPEEMENLIVLDN